MKKRLIVLRDNIKKLGVLGVIPFVFWPVFFLVVTFFIYKTQYDISMANIEAGTIIETYNVAEGFKDYINNVTLIVDTASETISDMVKQNKSTYAIQAYLERKSKDLNSIAAGDTKGIYGYIRGEYVDGDNWIPDEDYVPTERIWYKKAVEADGDKILVDPYVDARTGKLVVTASKLLPDKESVLAIDIWLSRMQQMTEDVGGSDPDHLVMILDRDGNVVAHSDPEQVGQNYRQSSAVQKRNIYWGWQRSNGGVFTVTIGDTDYLLYPKDISDSWTVITMNSAAPAMKEIVKLTRIVMLSAIIGLVATFAVLFNISTQKIKVMDYAENVQSIANIYSSMHKIDLETYNFEVIINKNLYAANLVGMSRTNGDTVIKSVMEKIVDARSREEILEFVDVTTLNERMGDSDSISIEFLDWDHKWDRARFIVAERKPDKSLKAVLYTVESIDNEKRSREKLRYLAETDQLTKINNRGSGESKIRNLLQNSEGGMFVLFDVDHFKSINDNFGHNVGDKVLISIGEAMQKTFRDKDIILRLGGDEFAAFTPGVFTEEAGRHLIDRLISAVEKIRIPEISSLTVNISVGAAFYMPDDDYSFEELYKHADSCTYVSKKTKGSQVTFYEEISNS